MPEKIIHVLLVEDHPSDITLTRRAFSRISTPNQLHVVLDGREALRFLRGEGRYDTAPRPDFILLDLNMPRMGGLEVLAVVDKDPTLRTIPVVILTTSSAPLDVQRAYSLCANSYLVKPIKYSDFQDLILALEAYWLQTSLLPPRQLP